MRLIDTDRPKVLAHERFVSERDRFEGMTLAERFVAIHNINLWGAATSVSGLGSEAGATKTIVRELPFLLRKLQASSLLDAPCGDASWIASTKLQGFRYTGVDIVPGLVTRNREQHGDLGEFFIADITCDDLPRADVVLCRDCLVHLSFDNIARAVANFRRSGGRWLITTTFPDMQQNQECEDGDWRGLNFERAPFAWREPVYLLNEVCEEAGGGWRDKSLGVWDLLQLPES